MHARRNIISGYTGQNLRKVKLITRSQVGRSGNRATGAESPTNDRIGKYLKCRLPAVRPIKFAAEFDVSAPTQCLAVCPLNLELRTSLR